MTISDSTAAGDRIDLDDRWDDLRLLRHAGGEAPQQDRRRHRDRQLLDREGAGRLDGPITAEQLIAEVEKAGYSAERARPVDTEVQVEDDPAKPWLNRLIISTILTVPVIAMAMIPALQFDYWQWLSLNLAAPVVVWGAFPFHRAAWVNLRHGAATMDTLISVGTIAAFGWSVYALFFGTAGEQGMKHPFRLTIERMDGSSNIYLEAAAGVTTFILAGRYFEVRSKRRAGSALRALLDLGAKDVAVLRDGVESVSPWSSCSKATCSSYVPVRRSRPTELSIEGSSAVDASMITGESVPAEVVVGDAVVGGTVNTSGRLVVQATRVGCCDPAGADGADGRGRAERQGAGAAAGRLDLGRSSCRS